MPIRANAVEVAKIFQARCHIWGCDWAGELLGTYQEANYDRKAHLNEHREQEAAQRREMTAARAEEVNL